MTDEEHLIKFKEKCVELMLRREQLFGAVCCATAGDVQFVYVNGEYRELILIAQPSNLVAELVNVALIMACRTGSPRYLLSLPFFKKDAPSRGIYVLFAIVNLLTHEHVISGTWMSELNGAACSIQIDRTPPDVVGYAEFASALPSGNGKSEEFFKKHDPLPRLMEAGEVELV